jgi:hypothetical protein
MGPGRHDDDRQPWAGRPQEESAIARPSGKGSRDDKPSDVPSSRTRTRYVFGAEHSNPWTTIDESEVCPIRSRRIPHPLGTAAVVAASFGLEIAFSDGAQAALSSHGEVGAPHARSLTTREEPNSPLMASLAERGRKVLVEVQAPRPLHVRRRSVEERQRRDRPGDLAAARRSSSTDSSKTGFVTEAVLVPFSPTGACRHSCLP